MRHHPGDHHPARRHGVLWRRFGRRTTLAARTVPRVLRRPATVALFRSIESRTTHSERIGVPRINVAVNIVPGAPSHVGHRLGASLVRMSTPGQETGEQRLGRLVRRPGAAARGQQRPAAHRRSSFVVGPAPVEPSASAAGTLRTRGEHRGLINAPAARTIALSGPASQVASRRPSVADVRSVDNDRRLRDSDDERASAAPLDLERLTDKVVAAIDRRLWSHRERMGGR